MTKRLLIAFLSLYLTMHVSGCTSGGGQEDGEIAESNDGSFSDESDSDFADSEAVEGGDTSAEIAEETAPAGDEATGSLDEFSEDVAADGSAAPAEGDVATSDVPVSDELSLDTAEPLPEEAAAAPAPEAAADVAANAAPPTDEPVFDAPPPEPAPEMSPVQEPVAEAAPADAAPTETAATDAPAEPPPAPKVFAPLKKIKTQAFAAADGTNLNRVYLARPGDTLKSVSQKIYGKNRSKDLKAWNGKSSIKTGDKIYYASPNDAADSSMKVFYEDIGVQPSTYTSKDGDNIRAVSTQLLGHSQSWKEVWATNESVESKGDIPAGLEIRYWPEGSEASAMMAKTQAPPASDLPPPPVPEMNELPPPPPTDMAMNDLPPPPTAGTMEPPPPAPTVPPMETPMPAPAEPPKVAKRPIEHVESEPEADQMMWLTAGGIMLLAAVVLYVIIKKNRSKRIDLSQTQV